MGVAGTAVIVMPPLYVPATSTTKTFTLEPGTYVAFCNIVDEMGMAGDTTAGSDNMPMGGGTDSTMMIGGASGHVHFAEGMYMTFTVK